MAKTTALRSLLVASVATATAFCFAGCSEPEHSLGMVQICVATTEEIPGFVNFMNEIAREYRMESYDRSSEMGEELRALAVHNKDVPVPARPVNISARRDDAFGFSAGNLGLPDRQIAIGFWGTDLAATRQFKASAIEKLSTRWRVHKVPHDQGALPLSECKSDQSSDGNAAD